MIADLGIWRCARPLKRYRNEGAIVAALAPYAFGATRWPRLSHAATVAPVVAQ
jgi:hypothetical protein